MSRVVPNKWKIFDTNSKLLSEVIIGSNKDCLLGKPVDYNQNSVKSR